MSYYLAASLRALTAEVTARWSPRWPTVGLGDGWVGDTSHQARKSDHNPDWSSGGVVRAVDIGIQGRNARAILDAAIGDSRVWYVIHKGRIYSRTYGWVSRRYTGHPHNHHIHISIRHSRAAETDTSRWLGGAPKPKDWFDMASEADLRKIVRQEIRRFWDEPVKVRTLAGRHKNVPRWKVSVRAGNAVIEGKSSDWGRD